METLVEIKDGIATVIRREILGNAPITEIAGLIQTRTPTIFPILPDHTRLVAYDPDNNRGRLIVQSPPEVVGFRIHFDDQYDRMPKVDREKADRNRYHTFQLQFPWAIHYFGFKVETGKTERAKEGYGKIYHEQLQGFLIDETGYYWSDKPITEMDQYIFPGMMLNINNKGGICWGSTTGPTKTLAERLDALVKNFYATQYNDHYGYRVPPKYKSYTEWEEDSKSNPLCYLDWPMWDIAQNPEGITVARRLQLYMDQSQVHAESTIMPPPNQFTIGRLIEWYEGLPANEKIRFAAAARALSERTDIETALSQIDFGPEIKTAKKKKTAEEAAFA